MGGDARRDLGEAPGAGPCATSTLSEATLGEAARARRHFERRRLRRRSSKWRHGRRRPVAPGSELWGAHAAGATRRPWGRGTALAPAPAAPSRGLTPCKVAMRGLAAHFEALFLQMRRRLTHIWACAEARSGAAPTEAAGTGGCGPTRGGGVAIGGRVWAEPALRAAADASSQACQRGRSRRWPLWGAEVARVGPVCGGAASSGGHWGGAASSGEHGFGLGRPEATGASGTVAVWLRANNGFSPIFFQCNYCSYMYMRCDAM